MSDEIHAGVEDPATAQMIGLDEFADEPKPHGGRPLLHTASPLHAVRARLQVCVGEVEITVGELLAAKEQQVLTLDRTLEDPVDLLLEGRVVARGQLVAVDGHFALRISDLPVALKL